MKWPFEIGVMTLSNVILFPQAFLPLYIFEPRYRRMLADALESHRMFGVAMRQPGTTRESPTLIAGIGLVRAAREHADGTSHLILQGLSRVELGEVVRYRPYRVHRIRVLESMVTDSAAVDALTARLLELVAEQLQEGGSVLTPFGQGDATALSGVPPKKGVEFLARLDNPDQIADLVSWALLSNPGQRQLLLETLDLETRLRKLIKFLLAERASES